MALMKAGMWFVTIFCLIAKTTPSNSSKDAQIIKLSLNQET